MLRGRVGLRRTAALVAAAVGMALLGAGHAAAAGSTLYVSTNGSNTANCSAAHPCRTITHAVAVANAGDTIIVRAGVYREGVVVQKKLHLIGVRWPIVNALGRQNGFMLNGAGAAGSSIRGFTVTNATQEGILAMQTSWVTIRGNLVVHNDLGMFAANPTGECAAQGQIPGDCGEGIHLMSVSHSQVVGNRSTNNAGGILMTDEFGPSHHNLIGWNRVWRNQFDCGITIPSHNPNALSSTGVRQPSMGGVYANLITHNIVNGNGLKGEGAGILLAVGPPGGAVYNNVVSWNTAIGNDLAGITMHLHAPNQDLNGNRLMANRLSHNNLGGDPDAGVTQTTDILVFSAVVPITGTVIRGNWLSDAHFGIWTLNGHAGLRGNHFSNVAVPVHQS